MTRKLYLSLLLPVFMLLAQQGAVWHEIGHFGGDTANVTLSHGQKDSKAEPYSESSTDKLCDICLAFAHLAVAANPDVPILSLLSFGFASVQWVTTSTLVADAPAQRNCGPPHFL